MKQEILISYQAIPARRGQLLCKTFIMNGLDFGCKWDGLEEEVFRVPQNHMQS